MLNSVLIIAIFYFSKKPAFALPQNLFSHLTDIIYEQSLFIIKWLDSMACVQIWLPPL